MITISHLSVTHATQELLHIDSLQLKATGAIALIGPNGSGKTTFLKCLSGINSVSDKQILLNNKPLHQYSGEERARLIGYIPQNFTPCWNQRVSELLTLAATRSINPTTAIINICQQFELSLLLNQHWDSLSGGEKSRVLAAMALIGDPPILLADEPGAALDIKHRLQLTEQLAERGKHQLVLVCLHELELAFRYFEKVILLNNGKMIFSGNSSDLLHQPLLDKTFGVNFQRIETEEGFLLYASSADKQQIS